MISRRLRDRIIDAARSIDIHIGVVIARLRFCRYIDLVDNIL